MKEMMLLRRAKRTTIKTNTKVLSSSHDSDATPFLSVSRVSQSLEDGVELILRVGYNAVPVTAYRRIIHSNDSPNNNNKRRTTAKRTNPTVCYVQWMMLLFCLTVGGVNSFVVMDLSASLGNHDDDDDDFCRRLIDLTFRRKRNWVVVRCAPTGVFPWHVHLVHK